MNNLHHHYLYYRINYKNDDTGNNNNSNSNRSIPLHCLRIVYLSVIYHACFSVQKACIEGQFMMQRLLKSGCCCCLLVAQHPSNMLVYPRGRSAHRSKLQIKLLGATDQTFYLTQSQYIDTRPTSPSADPKTPS